MKHIKTFFVLTLILLLQIRCKSTTVNCVIETSKGSIYVELYPEKAPITVANFLKYVDDNKYENASFFRVCNPQNEADREIQIDVIQAVAQEKVENFPPIQIETTEQTGIKHLNGTISMARLEPNTATNSFFICIGDQPELDYAGKRNPDGQGFAAFGKVTKGMDIARAINKLKDTAQLLIEPVLIKNIKRID